MERIYLSSHAGKTVRAAIELIANATLGTTPIKYKGDGDVIRWAVLVDNEIFIWKAD